MGVQERKQREKAAMQRLILETANSLFEKKGIENISIRNIANAIEYSPATIYLYFKDKNEILSLSHRYFHQKNLKQS
jgi:AcrR family transcriptional regulator